VASSEVQPQAHLVVWGTDVNVVETKEKFKDFLKYFMDDLEKEGEEEPMGGAEPYYMVRLDEVGDYWWVGLCVLMWAGCKIATKFLFVISNQVLFCLAYFKINTCIID